MRVLMVSKALVVGIYQRKLEALAERGVDLIAVVPPSWDSPGGSQTLERLHTHGYQLEVAPIRFNGNFHLHYYPTLPALIRRYQPQIVHIDEEPYNAATWHALYHSRRHGAKTLFFSWQNIERRYPPPFAWGERYVLNRIDYAIMGTQDAANVWRAKGYQKPYRVIQQFGVDPSLFAFTVRDMSPIVTIAYIGRVVPEKGIDTLFQALANVGGSWRLQLIGNGTERPVLEALAHTLNIADRVEFAGAVPSSGMPDVYRRVDIVVLPSLTRPNWKEQFGRVLIEAMASGAVVVGSNSGAIPEVISDCGVVFPEGDESALAQALTRLIADPGLRAEYARKGRDRVESRYTTDHVADETVGVYRELNNTADASGRVPHL